MHRNHCQGVSLIEVLIAFAVLTIAVLALMGLLPAAAAQSASTDLQNQALLLAEHKMDELLQAGSSVAASPTGSPTNPLPEYPGLQLAWSGSPDPGGQPNLQLVTVEVTWVERATPRRVRLISLLAH